MTHEPNRRVPPLRGSLIGGTLWMVAGRWGVRFIGLFSTVILARLLVPADFGLVAMAMIVVGLVDVLFAYGVDTALIQNPNAGKDHLDTAWTIGIIQGALVAILLFLVAPLAAAYFKEPRVADLARVLSVAVVVRSLGNVGVVAFRKELRFHKEFQFMVVAKLLSFVATVSLAIILRNYWALVLGQIVGSALGCLQSYLMHPYRPSLSLKAVRELWSFSQWMLLVNIFNYALNKVDEIVVGGQGNGTSMGIYSVSSEIAQLPTTELAFPLARTLLPGYALLKADPGRLNQAFLNVLGFVSTVAIGAALGVSMVAQHLVPVLLGEKWLETVPLIQALAVYGMFRAISGRAGDLLLVLGRMRLLAAIALVQVIATLVAALIGINVAGVLGVALGKVVTELLLFVVMFYTVTRSSSITHRGIAARMWRPAVAGLAMVLAIQAFATPASMNHLAALIFCIIVGAVVYTTVLFLLWHVCGRPSGAESFLLEIALKKRRGSGEI